ncbi:peptidoglycan editing factor PgeF [Methylocella sp. CPCC 101449]|uniref:peptidoglycan editing factor PgeF n=1 Tax=Methylocella sp. CPCC 101449 TaxID=2987531 RepID=UPI00289075D3|nr:peptidoglycan editing factor PgeF [Methylocella sp. CPCC 101449]MDT2021715.1 peptidoglycan editing factor PgeF [Methylocella sp. CPCC 101449]
MSALPVIRSRLLEAAGVSHAFFTRQGGVSTGVYASLNGGAGSRDDAAAVAENKRRMADTLGITADRFMVPYQIHSADAVAIAASWSEAERPRCDGVATATTGLGLGVTGADCGILLFADARAGVIGAAHAGWKGAFDGVIEATLQRMEELGAKRANVSVVLGPTIAQASYEVGPEFVARFRAADAGNERFFVPSPRADHAMFDLPAFIGAQLDKAHVGAFENLALDTYADEERFYSYRRTTHRGENDYGRLIAAIALN